MKIKHIVLATTMMVTLSTFAQKDELKALKKIYAKEEIKGNDLIEYKSILTKLEPIAIEEADKIYATFYKSMLPILELSALDKTMTPLQIQMQMAKSVTPKAISELAVGLNATLDYEKKSGKKIYTDDINETITSYKPELLNLAVELGKANKYKEASQILYAIYQLDKKDVDKLYYAANYAVNAEDYDAALDFYGQLKDLNYSGEGTSYLAVNKKTKIEEFFGSKSERDLYIKAGTHENPKDDKIPSKRGEIYKNVALILVQKGKTEEAKAAIVEARKLNPEDSSLIITEADLCLKVKDFEGYTKLVNEVLERDPNNVDLIFNLGVISSNANKIEDAEKYYRHVIEIDPNYFNAYLNLAELKLRADEKWVVEMNKLGTSEKDNKKYESLKSQRNKNFTDVLPILEKAVELESSNEAANKTLLSVYNALELTEKYKALKSKMAK